jgi:CheY-like chemotaxis protein
MEKKPLVLIIEDNDDFQNLYGMIAEQAGFEVESIYDGQEGLKRLEEGLLPALVLLDSRLPGADGMEILSAARARDRWVKVPIYLLTADTRVAKGRGEFKREMEQADGVLEKGGNLIPQLRELFARHRGE